MRGVTSCSLPWSSDSSPQQVARAGGAQASAEALLRRGADLRDEGVSDPFVRDMGNWPGFVASDADSASSQAA